MFSSYVLFLPRESLLFHKTKPLTVFGMARMVLPVPGLFRLHSALNITVLGNPFLKFCSPAFQALNCFASCFPLWGRQSQSQMVSSVLCEGY